MDRTNAILREYDYLETQLRTVALAVKMLKDIGVKVK